jgi:hypothetical protein
MAAAVFGDMVADFLADFQPFLFDRHGTRPARPP